MLVDVDTKNFGYERLTYSQQFFPLIEQLILTHGNPNFIYEFQTEDKKESLSLFYVNDDSVYVFRRMGWNSHSLRLSERRPLADFERTIHQQLLTIKETKPNSPWQLTAEAFHFKTYDEQVRRIIADHWKKLLQPIAKPNIVVGMVVLEFRLTDDGRITNIKVIKNTTDDSLADICKKAISEPAPYEKWTPTMINFMGRPYRTHKYTFHYR